MGVLQKNCPICSTVLENQESLFLVRHFNHNILYSWCDNCTLLYQNPAKNQQDWDEFYKKDYKVLYNRCDSEVVSESLVDQQRLRAQMISSFLKDNSQIFTGDHYNSGLDFGCSAGTLLDEIKETQGIEDTWGIELDSKFRTRSLLRHNCVSRLEEINASKKFDLITISHVLEHFAEPLLNLKSIVGRLRNSDSVIYIEVPNALGGRPFEVAHPFAFTPFSLTYLLELAGLSVCLIELHNSYKTAKTGALYISVLCKLKNSTRTCMTINNTSVTKPSRFSLVQKNLLAHYGWKNMPYKLFSTLINGSRPVVLDVQ